MRSGINVFIRQPFTQSDGQKKKIIQDVMDVIVSYQPLFDLQFLTEPIAQTKESFKENFTKSFKQPFTPEHFRNYRLNLLNQADAFIQIRTGMSESSAFEIAYNIFQGKNAPIFFAIEENAPIKTTLLRELEGLNKVTYVTFSQIDELREPLKHYFAELAESLHI